MLIFTIFIYLSGAAVVVLQLLRPKRLLYLRFCKCLLNNAFAEGLLPVAGEFLVDCLQLVILVLMPAASEFDV